MKHSISPNNFAKNPVDDFGLEDLNLPTLIHWQAYEALINKNKLKFFNIIKNHIGYFYNFITYNVAATTLMKHNIIEFNFKPNIFIYIRPYRIANYLYNKKD